MDYAKIDLSKIQYELVADPPHIEIKYDNKKFRINTPIITIPFGVDEVYDKYYTKLQFDNYQTDHDVGLFYDKMLAIEEHIKEFIKDTIPGDFEVSSEFNYKDNHYPTINTKLVTYRGKISTRIISSSSSFLNYWQLNPGTLVKCKMSLTGVWIVKNKFHYKWNVDEIKLME